MNGTSISGNKTIVQTIFNCKIKIFLYIAVGQDIYIPLDIYFFFILVILSSVFNIV